MFTDRDFYRESLQQGSTHILRHLPPASKKDKKKRKARGPLGFQVPSRNAEKRRG